MPDPRYRYGEKRNHSSAFWGIAMVFAVLMLALVAYGYHGIRTSSTASTTPGATTGQSTTEGSATRAPTPAGAP